MYTDSMINKTPVARIFAWVIAYSTVDGRHRIFFNEFLPGFVVFSGLCKRQPGLDIFTGRTGMIAGWKEILVNRSGCAMRSCAFRVTGKIRGGGQICFRGAHAQ
jgi:hypothetical protein